MTTLHRPPAHQGFIQALKTQVESLLDKHVLDKEVDLPAILQETALKLARDPREVIEDWYIKHGDIKLERMSCGFALSLGVLDLDKHGFFDGEKWFCHYPDTTNFKHVQWDGPFEQATDAVIEILVHDTLAPRAA